MARPKQNSHKIVLCTNTSTNMKQENTASGINYTIMTKQKQPVDNKNPYLSL